MSESPGGDHDSVTGFNEYLAKIILKKSKTANNSDNFPPSPIIFCMARIPPISDNMLQNFPKEENKNAPTLTNGTVYPFKKMLNGNSKNNRLEKNPSLMESILNPFFLKAFRNNEVVNEKKQTKDTSANHSESTALEKKYNCYSSSDTLAESTSLKYKGFNDDVVLIDKIPRLFHSKLQSLADNLESPYYRFKSKNRGSFNIFHKNIHGLNRSYVNSKIKSYGLLNNNLDNSSPRAVGLVDLVKTGDAIGTLLNQTLLSFSVQIFGLLEGSDPVGFGEWDNMKSKVWNNMKKKLTGRRGKHDNLSYELIRGTNESKPRW